jgi:hypothetical protein
MVQIWSLLIFVFAYFSVSYAVKNGHCRRYGVVSEQLQQTRGKVEFDDGSFYEQVTEGSLRFLRMNFNRTVLLFSVTAQMRVNRELRIITYDANNDLQSRFFQIQAGKKVPLETLMVEQPPVRRVMLQGFDAQLTYDETIYVNMTVCAHNCRDVSGCFGNCIAIEKDFGCLECRCPEGSPSNGCTGVPDIDSPKLLESVKKQVLGCSMSVGYKRMIDAKLDLDDCIAFEYPKCTGQSKNETISVPKSRIECLKFCY